MSDTDKKKIADSCDSNSSDNCQDYFLDLEGKPIEDSCPICCEKLNGKIGSPGQCNHFFCLDCISQWAKRIRTCPLDRKEFSSIQLFEKRDGKMHISDEASIDLLENNIESLNRLPLDFDFGNVTEFLNISSALGIDPSMDLMDLEELIGPSHNPEYNVLGIPSTSPINGRELMQLINLSNH